MDGGETSAMGEFNGLLKVSSSKLLRKRNCHKLVTRLPELNTYAVTTAEVNDYLIIWFKKNFKNFF